MSAYNNLLTDDNPLVAFNTGTLYDLMSGSYIQGYDGKWYLRGGFAQVIYGLHGIGNTYKSTLMDGLLMGALRNYPTDKCLCYDSERSKDKFRTTGFMEGQLHGFEDMTDNFFLKAGGAWTITKTWDDIIALCHARAANPAEFMIDTPFVDYAGKRIRVMRPDYAYIDTLTELTAAKELDKLEGDIEDKKNKTVYMEDGNMKTQMISALNKYCSIYGITVLTTAHTGETISMDGRPMSKELQHQKQGQVIKGVGSRYTRLTHVLSQIVSCGLCQDSAKKAKFCNGTTGDMDLQEAKMMISRNKFGSSGVAVPFVMSQHDGLLNDVTNLNFLMQNGYDGMTKGASAASNSVVWLPETKFTRNTVRGKAQEDYKLARAIELVARYRYIQMYWNTTSIPFDFSQPAEKVFDLLQKSSRKVDGILETTSNWHNIKGGREIMTIMDIIGMLKKAA